MHAVFDRFTPLRRYKWNRKVKAFLADMARRGIVLRGPDTPKALADIRTACIDGKLLMEGRNMVRMAAAPVELCAMDTFKKQKVWMMLTAGVSLGCDGYAPLEDFARDMSFERTRMAKQFPKVDAIAYDDERRMETTVHRDAGGLRAYAKGETEAVLSRCTQVLDGRERPLLEKDRELALESARKMEAEGLETLAFATKYLDEPGEYEQDMVFLGIIGMGDMPNPTAREAINAFRQLDIRPVLVSESALLEGAVSATGILRSEDGIRYASELETLDSAALRDDARNVDAFLCLDSAQRGKLMRALRADGPVASIVAGEQGGVGIMLGRGESGEAGIARGTLSDIAPLLAQCRELMELQ